VLSKASPTLVIHFASSGKFIPSALKRLFVAHIPYLLVNCSEIPTPFALTLCLINIFGLPELSSQTLLFFALDANCL
jgi:hypothetical protein